MIPKKIHTCWFGTNPIPSKHLQYIEGWRRLHPDYEIRIWTDVDLPQLVGDNEYVRKALVDKQYAFLSDYVRLVVLRSYGGIYADTDVEMLKSFDSLLDSKLLLGFIFDSSIGTAVIGAEPDNAVIVQWINIMDSNINRPYEVNNNWVTRYFIENRPDFRLNGCRQSLSGGIEIFPKDYFERYQIDKSSGGGYSEHHCAGSWMSNAVEPWWKRILRVLIGRKWSSKLGHWMAIKKTPYYEVYLKHIKL